MSSICIIDDGVVEVTVEESPTLIQVIEQVPEIIQVVGETVTIQDEGAVSVVSDLTPVPIIAECKIGPPGANGLDGFGILQIDSGPVANGNTVTADAVAIATYRSAKWLVTIKDETAGTYRFYEVIAVHNGTTPLYSVYGKVGDSISVFTNVTIVAGFLRLEITNNSTNAINISVMRIVTTV
ncbi:MAG: hypothetical protein ACTSX2_01345 [Candidatus Thorarchaeota archaeon]